MLCNLTRSDVAANQHGLIVTFKCSNTIQFGERKLHIPQDRFIAAFRRALSATGLPNASCYRGHSFRRGAASWAFNHGVPSELIQIYGDWASDAYKAYLEFSVESKLAFAQQLRFAVLSSTS